MYLIDTIISSIIAREGGFVNDPDDLGGATNMGVTIHTLRRLGLDFDGDGDIDTADVKKLTQERVHEIYKEQYFIKPRIVELPGILHETVFDMHVNAGANAIRILQDLLTTMGFECGTTDGHIGRMTIRAAMNAAELAPNHIVDAYGIERRNYYFSIADKRPESRKFCVTRSGRKGGWVKRAEEFISARYHLTQNQFQERIAQWA